MLPSKLYAGLDQLGLGHLADLPLHVVRANGALHECDSSCRLAVSDTAERITLTPRTVNERVCGCLEDLACLLPGSPSALVEARFLVGLHRRRPRGPVPTGTSYEVLVAATERLNLLERFLVKLSWTTQAVPAAARAANRLREEFGAEADELLQLIRSSGAEAVRSAYAAVSASGVLAAPAERQVLVSLLGQRGLHLLVKEWRLEVEAGLDREQRRRSASALLGSFLSHEVEGSSPPGHLRSRVLTALEALNGIEDRLEALLSSPPPLVLYPYSHSGGLHLGDAHWRLALEAHTVARNGSSRLLALPAALVPDLVPDFDAPLSSLVRLPSDPALAETAVRMWDPVLGSTFSDPARLVEVAALV